MDTETLARQLADTLQALLDDAAATLAAQCSVDGGLDSDRMDAHQPLLYELATLSSALAAGRDLLAESDDGDLALIHLTRVAADAASRLTGRVPTAALDSASAALAAGRSPELIERVAAKVLATGEAGTRGLSEELEMVRQSFRGFAEERVGPVAEKVHREDTDIPEEIITELAAMGCFALSVPAEYGGLAEGGPDELLSMVVVTEELSRVSLGAAGSLITRPEIVAAAIARGGTAEQRERLLPAIASGEMMTAVAVTEPDAGSDVARMRVAARRDGDGWVIDGVKTWCTFAGRAEALLVLARTDGDPTSGHRGLSLFLVEKPRAAGHHFAFSQDDGGSIEGRAIPTLGYRGMHSFEVSFDGWKVGPEALIGGEDGLGRGFYLQMQAFANARLQTAARAQGVMQAAIEDAVAYTSARRLFGQMLSDLPLTRERLAGMAATLAACRASATAVARAIATEDPRAAAAASEVKLLACRAAEWVTREAQQMHGGYGYAEEYRVSRLFVDARVLSIFEGADEVLALKVVGRGMLADALARAA